LPEILGHEFVARHKDRLSAEWRPSTATQEILVGELARHAGALALIEQCEAAVLRTGARGVLSLASHPDPEDQSCVDAILAGAVTSEAIDRLTRYRRAHEKGWHAALLRLREAKAAEGPAGQRMPGRGALRIGPAAPPGCWRDRPLARRQCRSSSAALRSGRYHYRAASGSGGTAF
jgi:hypothetical protein